MIERWSEGIADDNMAEEILVELAALIRRHPWWQARAALTLDLLRAGPAAPGAGPRRGLRLGRHPGCPGTAGLSGRRHGHLAADAREAGPAGPRLIEADLTRPLAADVEPTTRCWPWT